MASCAHCRGRKGKRECPALGGKICSACCGQYRLVEIQCPSDCVYLASHETYQRRRTLDKTPTAWRRRVMAYGRKPAAEQIVMHEIHLTICGFDAHKGRLELDSVREGLEFARRRMSLIETPEPYVPPFGEALVQKMDEVIQKEALVEREGVRLGLEEIRRHLDSEVSQESFVDYLKFLRALYADQLMPKEPHPGADSPLIIPGS